MSSNFYWFIASNNSLLSTSATTNIQSVKQRYADIQQIRSVWYQCLNTSSRTPVFTIDNGNYYINVYLVVKRTSDTALIKTQFWFGSTTSYTPDLSGNTNWSKDWPTNTGSYSWASTQTSTLGWLASASTIITPNYNDTGTTITFGTDTNRYYGYRVNVPAQNFADFISTSLSMSDMSGSFQDRLLTSAGNGVPASIYYGVINGTSDVSVNPITGIPPFGTNWTLTSSYVLTYVKSTTAFVVNTRFGFKVLPSVIQNLNWSTGQYLDSSGNWPTDISFSKDLNNLDTKNSWHTNSVRQQAWATATDTATPTYNSVINRATNGPLPTDTDPNYKKINIVNYSTPYVPPNFSVSTASSISSLGLLTNTLDIFLGIPKEIYNIWYKTSEATGSETTTCWVYYAYTDNQSVLQYSSRSVQYNNSTNSWTVLGTANTATKTNNGLSTADLTGYAVLYTGLSPFNIDVSSVSISALTTAYNASTYPSADLSQVYNIWYDISLAFDMSYSNTSRKVPCWLYAYTTDLSYENRIVNYNVNSSGAYTWTITPTISANYASELDISLSTAELQTYALTYFKLDKYILTTSSQISKIQTVYNAVKTDASFAQINEIWYKKQTIGDGSTDHTATTIVETGDISYNAIEMQIYYLKNTFDQANNPITAYGSNRIDYSKTSRTWNIPNIAAETTTTSGISDGLSAQGYQQTYYNIYLDTSNNQIPNIKTAYASAHTPLSISTILKMWSGDTTSKNNIMQILIAFTLTNSPSTQKYTLGYYNRVINTWSIPDASMAYDATNADNLIFTQFSSILLENATAQIKTAYNTAFLANTMLNIYSLWYNQTTVSGTDIECKVYYSYVASTTPLITNFATISVNYSNSTGAWVAQTNQLDASYNNYGTIDANFILIPSYTQTPTFTIGLLPTDNTPILDTTSGDNTKTRYGTSYSNVYNGQTVNNIHAIWCNTQNATVNSGVSIVYSIPIIDTRVYYSYNSTSVSDVSYASRDVSYNLQTNQWLITTQDGLKTGDIRRTGLTTADLTNYLKIYDSPPIIPPFPINTAISDDSLGDLKTAYNTYSTGKTATDILQMWYNTTTTYDEVVRCIVYMSYTQNSSVGYSTFDISYNTSSISTQPWLLSASNKTTNATQNASNLTTLISLMGESIGNYVSFYTIPIGTSLLGTGIRYYDNSIQTTAMPPIGTIIVWSGETLPSGYLWCDGTSYNPSDSLYVRLFNILQYNYGTETVGATAKFRVPDLRSRFPIGYSNNLSTQDPVAVAVSRSGGNSQIMPTQFVHNHTVNTSWVYTGINTRQNADPGSNSARYDGPYYHYDTILTDYNTYNPSTQFYPTFVVFKFIIKYK